MTDWDHSVAETILNAQHIEDMEQLSVGGACHQHHLMRRRVPVVGCGDLFAELGLEDGALRAARQVDQVSRRCSQGGSTVVEVEPGLSAGMGPCAFADSVDEMRLPEVACVDEGSDDVDDVVG